MYLTPQARNMISSAYMQDTGMSGGEYLDLDYGGANSNQYTSFRKLFTNQAKRMGILKVPNDYRLHQAYCAYVKLLGKASQACNRVAGQRLTRKTPAEIRAYLINRYYLNPRPQQAYYPQQSVTEEIFTESQPLINFQQQPLQPESLSSFSIENPVGEELRKCNAKITAIRNALGSGMGMDDMGMDDMGGILVGGAARRKRKSGSKTSKRSNPWSKFITLWAKKNGKTLTQAMKSAVAKRAYCSWIGKNKRAGVTRGKRCKLTKRPTKSQLSHRKKLERCASKKKSYSALINKCRAAGILME